MNACGVMESVVGIMRNKMTASEEEKPDGWIAWRKGVGFEVHYLDGDMGKCPVMPVYLREQDLTGLGSEWRIRPVKLVFIDEDK